MTRKTWYDHFKYSMDCAGVPAPMSLFETSEKALQTIAALVTVVKTYGTQVTLAEVVLTGAGAALVTDLAIVAAGVTAAYYAGCCIGAAAYASGQWTADNLWAVAPETGTYTQVMKDAKALGIEVPRDIAILAQRSAGMLKASVA